MPSQRALDIDALMALAQPAAYVIHGESHADLARQMARKHACLRQVLVAGETEGDDFTPNCAALSHRACISLSSPWRITFRWPAPVFWEPLPAAEKWY